MRKKETKRIIQPAMSRTILEPDTEGGWIAKDKAELLDFVEGRKKGKQYRFLF